MTPHRIDLAATMAYRPKLAVFFDPTIDMVNTFAAAHPDRFVFTFITCADVESVGDWQGLDPSNYVVRPIYIGNYATKDQEAIAEQVISNFLAS